MREAVARRRPATATGNEALGRHLAALWQGVREALDEVGAGSSAEAS